MPNDMLAADEVSEPQLGFKRLKLNHPPAAADTEMKADPVLWRVN